MDTDAPFQLECCPPTPPNGGIWGRSITSSLQHRSSRYLRTSIKPKHLHQRAKASAGLLCHNAGAHKHLADVLTKQGCSVLCEKGRLRQVKESAEPGRVDPG